MEFKMKNKMKFVFFGIGAASSVMAQALLELCGKTGIKAPSFLFVIRDKSVVKKYFFQHEKLLQNSKFLEVEEFDDIFTNPQKYESYFKNATVLINSSIPEFNQEIMKLALVFKTHYSDLASDIYSSKIIDNLQFEQQELHHEFQKNSLLALINLGISPGVTNLLIGERIEHFHNLPHKTKVKKIEIFLLEDIRSKQLVFSWAPNVAIEELSFRPAYFKQHKLKRVEPFSNSLSYEFPYFKGEVDVYPVFQEEIISLKQSFPDVPEIRMFVGGNEVELMKNLYQLNLLSHKYCFGYEDSQASINTIIKEVIPKMKSPDVMASYVKEKIIKAAQFCAAAELSLEIRFDEYKVQSTELVGVIFDSYLDLENTPYSGATYVSYPTGIGAALTLFYTLVGKKKINGVVTSEKLPALLGNTWCEMLKRELSVYKIGLFHLMLQSQTD
jgi:saccharopine dehydrogenase-like NADP-dependent oxidoreductase